MRTSDWFDLYDGWAFGSDVNPIYPDVKRICRLGLSINKETKKLSDVFADRHSKLWTATVGVFPKLLELNEDMSEMIGTFADLFIRCYGPSEKDLEVIERKKVESPIAENTEADDDKIESDEIFNIVSDLKPEDMDIKQTAEDIITEKKNPLVEFKSTIRTFKSRIDLMESIYRNKASVNEAQIMGLLTEYVKVTGELASAIRFAKKYYPNKYGIRLAFLYFIGMTPERVARRDKVKMNDSSNN